MTAEPTVFYVDDDPTMRASLELLLRSAGLQSEGYASAEEFLDRANPHRCGCLILDLKLGGMNGLALQKELRTRGASLPVVMISGNGEVPDAVEAMRSGAVDFIEKPFRGESLLQLVRAAIVSDTQVHRDNAVRRKIEDRIASLTPRDREIMELLLAGKAMKQIALRLGVAVQTVHKHTARIFSRLGVNNAVELTDKLRPLESSTTLGGASAQ